jgi:hypothetical protein
LAAGNTYSQITGGSVTLATAASSVTFSSIPATYTDLVLVCSIKQSTGGANVGLQFNNDTASNYSDTILTGNGSGTASIRNTSSTYIQTYYYGTPNATSFSPDIINIMNYANTTTYKTVLIRSGEAGGGLSAIVSLWRSTAAITEIDVNCLGGQNFAIGSTFNLYGIQSA